MSRLIPADPPGLALVVTREEALAAGLTHGRISWLVASGRWRTLVPGVYLRTWAMPSMSPHEAVEHVHALRAAAASTRRNGSTVAGASAALLHGLPLVTGAPEHATLLVGRGARREHRAGVRSRLGTVAEEDLVGIHVEGLGSVSATSVARALVDIAREHPLADVLSVGDAALRRGLMTRDEASDALDRAGTAPGVRRARAALPLLDPARESAMESGSAAHFIEWRFPIPRLQHIFVDSLGVFIARSDFDWPDHRVIGFADGMGKYGLDPHRDRNEHRQEARLRPHGTVGRWGWHDMAGPGLGLFVLLAPLLGFTGPMRVDDLWLP